VKGPRANEVDGRLQDTVHILEFEVETELSCLAAKGLPGAFVGYGEPWYSIAGSVIRPQLPVCFLIFDCILSIF
jgi:hypothetical protein